MTFQRGFTWNIRVRRTAVSIANDTRWILNIVEPDVAALQELVGNRKAMRRLVKPDKRYRMIVRGRGEAAQNTGFIVRKRKGQRIGGVRLLTLTETRWKRWHRPGMHPVRKSVKINVDGVLYVSVHAPPGGPNAKNPRQRAAYREHQRALAKWCNKRVRRNKPIALLGDWNTPPGNDAKYGPQWLAKQIGGRVVGTGIDYVIARGAEIENFRTLDSRGSDHPAKRFGVLVR